MFIRFISASVLIGLIGLAGCSPESSSSAPSAGESGAAPPQSPANAVSGASVKLTVTVIDLRNHTGQLIFGVFKTKDGFPSAEKHAVKWHVRSFDSNTVVFDAELPPGEYGASVLHDENHNNNMDKNLIGIPTEGYGVTNNPKPRFRGATFKESLFTLPKEGAELTISMQYF